MPDYSEVRGTFYATVVSVFPKAKKSKQCNKAK